MSSRVVNPFEEPKPYYGFTNLEIGNYEIFDFKFVKNRFAVNDPNVPPRIVLVELADQVLFLPTYITIKFDDDDTLLEAINNDGIRRFLCFKGKGPSG